MCATCRLWQCPACGTTTDPTHAGQPSYCRACTLREIGEPWGELLARTNRGIPRAKWYRDKITAMERKIAASRR